MTDHWHVRGTNWLATLPPAQVLAVRSGSAITVYEPGRRIEEVTLGYVRPGDLFGEVAVVTAAPRESFAVTRTRARVGRIPRALFERILRESHAVLYGVTRRIGARLLRCQSRIEDLVFRDVRSRLALMFLRLLDAGLIRRAECTLVAIDPDGLRALAGDSLAPAGAAAR